jgi:hypothetical protein
MQSDGVALPPFRPSRELLLGFMRGMGASENNASSAIRILEDLVQSEPTDTMRMSLDDCKDLINTLLRSCALLGLGHAIPTIFHLLVSSSQPSIRSSAFELVSNSDVDYVMSLLMASVAFTSDPKESMRYILGIQIESGLLPPALVFHSMVIEAQAQAWSKNPQTQLSVTLGLGTLPFRSFMLIGAVKHVSVMREFLSTCITNYKDLAHLMMTSSYEFEWKVHSSISSVYLCSHDVLRESVAQLFNVVGASSEELLAVDGVLVKYILEFSTRDLAEKMVSTDINTTYTRDSGTIGAPGNWSRGNPFGVYLCLQHLFGRFVAVKTRAAKEALSNQLNLALGKMGSAHALWMFGSRCIRLMTVIYCADDRSFPRFIQFLFRSLTTCAKLFDEVNGGADDITIVSMLGAFSDGRVGLDVFKIINKLFPLTDNPPTRPIAAAFIISTLEWNSENPLTVVRTLCELELCDHVDTEQLEERLLERCCEKPSKAIHEYVMTFFPADSKERWLAAVRIAQRTLHWNEPSWRDFLSSLLFKFHEPSAMATISADIETILQSDNRILAPARCADRPLDRSMGLESGEPYGSDFYERLTVIYVDNKVAVEEARTYLTAAADACCSSADEVYAVGVDAEWRPDRLNTGGEGKSMCALLQLADTERVFILDLIALDAQLEDFLLFFFSSSRITKLGFGIQEDLVRLRCRFPRLQGTCPQSVVDFQQVWSSLRRDPLRYSAAWASTGARSFRERLPRALAIRGLSGLVHLCCGVQLDKREQCSDWEARPLSGDQIRYATLDARCLVDVFQVTRNWELEFMKS